MIKPNLQAFPAKRRKAIRWIIGSIIAYTVIGFLILPPIARSVAIKQLSKQLDREVSIEKIKLNPYTLSTTIRGLLIKDKDGQPFISWDEVYVNFQLSSFFGHAWVFNEISTVRPFVRVQMNKDRSLNFSDLITKFSTNPSSPSATPSRPVVLHVDHLHISGATASLTDLTPRTPFKRIAGPLDISIENLRTDPDNLNPYSFSGTTDAGEKIVWSGRFCLDPLGSQGNLSVENFPLNKYAALFQDLVRFEVKDGLADVHSAYRVELSPSNHIASVTNASFTLRSFKLAEPNNDTNLVEIANVSVAGASLDVNTHVAEIALVSVTGAKIVLQRDKNNAINLVEAAKPAEAASAPGGIQLLLRSVTNAVALLLSSTNDWKASLDQLAVRDCSVDLADLAHSRPALLTLDDITLTATNLSNQPGKDLTASLSLRWNTNGTIKLDSTASFRPPTVDLSIALENLELNSIDPYLEPMANVFIVSSKLSLDGQLQLRTTNTGLPNVTFQGNVRLADFSTVDGVLGEPLLKWGSVKLSGIDANLNPLAVAIKEIALDDVGARVLIETNHVINLQAALHPTDTNVAAGPPKPTTAETAGKKKGGTVEPLSGSDTNTSGTLSLPNISIGAIVISNAEVQFTDRSLQPNVNLSIRQVGGTIAGLSSAELQHAEVNLHARVDGVGPVEISGTINPFSGELTNELKITARNVDLTPVSPYSGEFAGYRIARGKLNLELAYHLKGRALKSENLITLDQFTFGARVDSPEATKLPVRLAVAILKDRNGKIELDVPVEGNFNDPDFRVRKVILHTVLNLLARVATSPFSLLGSLFGGKGEEIQYQDFIPGNSELRPAVTNKLDALVNGLYQRPGLQLEIEGSIDPDADREGLRRVELDKRLRTEKWQSLRKSARAATTPDQIVLTAEDRTDLIKKLYGRALGDGTLDLSKLSADTNTAALAVQLQTRGTESVRGSALLITNPRTQEQPAGGTLAPVSTPALPPITDPMERALLTIMPVTDAGLEMLASARAKVVREYILRTGRVEADRLFLTERQPGGIKTEGARTYLQLQ